MNGERTGELPIDRACAAVGIANDTELHRRGGPTREALRRLRSGKTLRADAMRRLAHVLGLTDAEGLALVRETAKAALGGRTA